LKKIICLIEFYKLTKLQETKKECARERFEFKLELGRILNHIVIKLFLSSRGAMQRINVRGLTHILFFVTYEVSKIA
jgi:hypothetical protein